MVTPSQPTNPSNPSNSSELAKANEHLAPIPVRCLCTLVPFGYGEELQIPAIDFGGYASLGYHAPHPDRNGMHFDHLDYLVADMRSCLANKQHNAYIVAVLSVYGLAPMGGLTLSNWPLHRRIRGQASEQVDLLRAICRTLDLDAIYPGTGWRAVAKRLSSEGPIDPKFDLRAQLAALIEPIEADDLQLRMKVADSAEQCDLVARLFGKLHAASMQGERV